MCLITVNWQPESDTPLVIAANRDEFYARPTLHLHHWPDYATLAGKDTQAGGTWLGLAHMAGTKNVRLAALTNYRDTQNHNPHAPSRGGITTSFLNGSMSASTYLQSLATTEGLYNPFNLIVFDGHELMGFESRHSRAFTLPPGITAISNADFNTPWPKLVRLQRGFEQAIAFQSNRPQLEKELFGLLAHDVVAPDTELPETGISLTRERALSAAFIRTPDYGTRACSVVTIATDRASFTERSFDAGGFRGEVKEYLSWSAP